MFRRLVAGLAAGATGTIALEVTSYLDILVRGRPPSDQPQRVGKALARALGMKFGKGRAANARTDALGSAVGYIDGLTLPVAYALSAPARDRPVGRAAVLLSLAAMVGSNWMPVALGLSDPRSWSIDDWLTDLVPHVVYGLVAATTYELLVCSDRTPASEPWPQSGANLHRPEPSHSAT